MTGGLASVRALHTGTESLIDLARRIKSGDILLPKFQREFVWNRKQVLELLDSVARDYPIGSVLLWQSREELASDRAIANLEVADPREDYPRNYLLDGQQRLSTICGALYWMPEGDPDSYWNIVYDLAAEEFTHASTLENPPVHQIPARLLSDGAAFFRCAGANLEEYRDRADRLYRRFQDYKIAVATIKDMDIDEVARVFERINSTATTLTIADLIRAATWTRDFDLADLLEDASLSLAPKRFDTVEPPTLLRIIAAAAEHGYDREDIDKLRRHSSAELRVVIKKASEGARRAADFLATDLGLPSAAALPYQNQFTVLADLFHRVDKPTSSQITALERWFWRTSFAGYFSGWSGRQMIATRDAIRAFAAGDIAELPPATGMPGADAWKRTRFRQGAAFSKAHALLLARERPVDLRSGRPIDVGKALSWSNDKEYHHFFPQAYLKKQGYGDAVINSVANIIMLTSITNIHISDQRPSEYLQDLIDMHGEATIRANCAASLVPPAAFDAALVNDYDTFLTERAALLCKRARDLTDTTRSITDP
ncbi:GmrSD restriction endonuclease domain-containing protein [Nocardia sp. Marseille-Q1738]